MEICLDPSTKNDKTLYTFPFVAMSLANMFVAASVGSFFLFPLFVTNHGGSESDIGIVMGVMVTASVLLRPWISEMIDRIGRKRSYAIGTVGLIVIPLFYLLFHGELSGFYLPLVGVRIVHGVGIALCYTAVFTFIIDIIPSHRMNEGIGMFGVSGLLGLGVGPAFAEAVVRHFGFAALFICVSAMGAASFLLQLPLKESYDPSVQEDKQRASFFTVLKKGRILLVAFLALLFGFGLSASGSFVSPFAKQQGISFISLYFLSYSAAAILTRFIGGRLADRFGEDRVAPYALVITGLGLVTMTLLGTKGYVLIVSGVMTGTGHGFLFPTLNSLAVRREPIEVRGRVTGIFTGGIDLGIFIASVSLGFIGDWFGLRFVFVAAGLAFFTGLVVFLFNKDHLC